MKISFSPMRMETPLSASLEGDVLTLPDGVFDLSVVSDGATLPKEAVATDWLVSDVERINGQIELTLLLPHGPNAPHETLFPEPVIATSGAIDVPAFDMPQDTEEAAQ